MRSMGTNEASITPGAATPTRATIGPMTAANEYAGDVAFKPIASASTNPIAPASSVSVVALSTGDDAIVVSLGCPRGAIQASAVPPCPPFA